MPALQVPSFGSQQYWEARFTSNAKPFEWLEKPNSLDPYLVPALKATEEQKPQILHIGSGTSLLSHHLRAHAKDPGLVHNLDYSQVAIQVGRKREMELFGNGGSLAELNSTNSNSGAPTGETKSTDASTVPNGDPGSHLTPGPSKFMRWSAADLLSLSSLLNVCEPSTYSVIVDKSTSDSIACSEDVCVPLPYGVGTVSERPVSSQLSTSPEPIHPLHIVAIHLALLAKPKARWISVSYSEDRYPFLPEPSTAPRSSNLVPDGSLDEEDGSLDGEDDSDSDSSLRGDLDDIPDEVIAGGLPDPATLWKLEAKHEIEVPPRTMPSGRTVHAPKELHWVYILQRTDVEVFVRDR